MESPEGSIQRSFRLSRGTVDLLDATAETTGESRNTLAAGLPGEALRLERHPSIRFHQGAGSRRQPFIVGTRLYVHQVISTVRASKADIDEAADYLAVAPRLVRAAVDYLYEHVPKPAFDRSVRSGDRSVVTVPAVQRRTHRSSPLALIHRWSGQNEA